MNQGTQVFERVGAEFINLSRATAIVCKREKHTDSVGSISVHMDGLAQPIATTEDAQANDKQSRVINTQVEKAGLHLLDRSAIRLDRLNRAAFTFVDGQPAKVQSATLWMEQRGGEVREIHLHNSENFADAQKLYELLIDIGSGVA